MPKKQIGFTALRAMGTGGVPAFLKHFAEPFLGNNATTFGSAVHAMLAGEDFDVSTSQNMMRDTKGNKRAWKPEELDHLFRLVKTAENSGVVPQGDQILREKEFFVERANFIYRAKPDVLCPETRTIWDYKTTSVRCDCELNAKKACNLVSERHLHVQLAYYASLVQASEGWTPENYRIVFLNANPKMTSIYDRLVLDVNLDPEWLQVGSDTLQNWILRLNDAHDHGFELNNEDCFINLEKPKWM